MKIFVVALISSLLGAMSVMSIDMMRGTDCMKANNNVRGSIEYRCGCSR